MREAKYINHRGQFAVFNDGGRYTLNTLPLYSYGAEPIVVSDRISDFTAAGVKSYAVEIGVTGTGRAATAQAWDELIALFYSDVSAGKRGRLIINGYALDCNVAAVEASTNFIRAKIAAFTVYYDESVWYRELQTTQYTPSSVLIVNDGDELDAIEYPHEYNTGYPSPVTTKYAVNPLLTPAHFRLTICGPVTTPTIIIGGHTYSVSATIEDGEQLIIDSRQKIITKINGSSTANLFGSRDREHYVFEKIPSGENTVAWTFIDKFFLTLIDERRLPPWST